MSCFFGSLSNCLKGFKVVSQAAAESLQCLLKEGKSDQQEIFSVLNKEPLEQQEGCKSRLVFKQYIKKKGKLKYLIKEIKSVTLIVGKTWKYITWSTAAILKNQQKGGSALHAHRERDLQWACRPNYFRANVIYTSGT